MFANVSDQEWEICSCNIPYGMTTDKTKSVTELVSVLVFFMSGFMCGRTWSLKPHPTVKHKQTQPKKPTRREHILCSGISEAQDSSSVTFLCKTHPEDNKSDSSEWKTCFPCKVLHILMFPHPDQEAGLRARNRWTHSTVSMRLGHYEGKTARAEQWWSSDTRLSSLSSDWNLFYFIHWALALFPSYWL